MNRFFNILLSILLLLTLAECAKIGSPSGGPRDKDPPVVIKSKPLNYSVRYRGEKIEITFDEYIKTDAISQEMVVSPPLKDRPEIYLKGKTLVIEWDEKLHDSTTYTFSFGESIRDLNEGNVLNNFEFVFSTGGHLDTLAIIGTVLQAFDLKPHEEKVFLTLFSDLTDSAPMKNTPDFVGLADPKGNFIVNNMRPDTYRLFAVQDLNRNYKYDVPDEFIGFADTLIYLFPSLFDTLYKTKWLKDSIALALQCDSVHGPLDSAVLALPGDSVHGPLNSAVLALPGDSLTGRLDAAFPVPGDSSNMPDSSLLSHIDSEGIKESDSITLADLAKWSIFVDLYLFHEDNEPQYLIDNTRKDRRKLEMRFNREVRDTVILEPLNFNPAPDWFIYEEHVMRDTFVYWISDSMVYKQDSLTVLASYTASDSMMRLVPFTDTLRFNFREPVRKETRRKKEKEDESEKPESLVMTARATSGNEQDLYLTFPLSFQTPISGIDTARIRLVKQVDTVLTAIPYQITPDPRQLRRYFLHADWESTSKYRMELFPGAFTDIYGLTNDTISVQFRARDQEYYSRILLSLSGVRGQKIIQLLDKNGKIARQRLVSSDGLVEFDYMPPAAFTLKLIHDRNGNGKWDSGDYLEHIQPERVEFNPGSFTLRSNFDMEVNWEIREQDPAVTGFIEPFTEGNGSTAGESQKESEVPDSGSLEDQ